MTMGKRLTRPHLLYEVFHVDFGSGHGRLRTAKLDRGIGLGHMLKKPKVNESPFKGGQLSENLAQSNDVIGTKSGFIVCDLFQEWCRLGRIVRCHGCIQTDSML